MPTTEDHRKRAEQNLRFAQTFNLNTTPYLDWVVVGYFYAALHLVDALLYHQERIDPPNHELRREYVKTKWYLRGIKNPYRELKDRSEDARYRLYVFTPVKIETVIIPLYHAIHEHIHQQLPPAVVA